MKIDPMLIFYAWCLMIFAIGFGTGAIVFGD